MSRIETLLSNCLKHNVACGVIGGKLLNYEGNAGTYWSVRETSAIAPRGGNKWRPLGVAHFLLGRVLPDVPPPTMDEESVQSGVGTKTVQEAMQHRFCIIVPQHADVTDPKAEWYRTQLAIAEEAAKTFASISSNQRSVRMLTIPTSYPVRSAGAQRDRTEYLIQHFPLVLESTEGEVLWEHPEAERMANGHRIASGNSAPATASSQTTRKPVAASVTSGNWHDELLQEAHEDGVPKDKIPATIRRRRIRFHRDAGLSEQAAEARFDEELKALATPVAANTAWHDELLREAREDGVPEDKIQATIRRRRIRFHRDAGLSEQAAEARIDEELKALATSGKATKATKKTPETPAKSGEIAPQPSDQEKSEASLLIEAILGSGRIDARELAANCQVSTSFIYMMKDGTRKGVNYVDRLRKIKNALDHGKPIPDPIKAVEKAPKNTKKSVKAPQKKAAGPRREKL